MQKVFSRHMQAYVIASYDPRFFFDSFVKIWVTCKNVWTNGPPPSPGKKLPVRLWRQELLSGVFDSPWAKCVKLNLKESVADYSHGLRTHCTGLNVPRFESNRCRGRNRVKQTHSLRIGRYLFLLLFKSILSKLYLVCDSNASLVSLWRANCSNIH